MSNQIRVLYADKSPEFRSVLSGELQSAPDITFVHGESDCRAVYSAFRSLDPDIVLIDVDLPPFGGIGALEAIREVSNDIPILMLSSATVTDREATLQALSAGASNFITKPENSSGTTSMIREQLLPQIRQWVGQTRYRQRISVSGSGKTDAPATTVAERMAEAARSLAKLRELDAIRNKEAAAERARQQQEQQQKAGATAPDARPDAGSDAMPETATKPERRESQPTVSEVAESNVLASESLPAETKDTTPVAAKTDKASGKFIAIGGCTGGPKALEAILSKLPADFPLPIVVVQHLLPGFIGLLSTKLRTVCSVDIAKATDGAPLRAGQVLLAPGEHHITVANSSRGVVVRLNNDPPVNSCKPAIDVLLKSAAQTYGDGCMSVVITGTGNDGTEGCRAVREAGGTVVAQDRDTCVIWGLPRAVEEAGLADHVLPLDQIADQMMEFAGVEVAV